MKSGKVTLKKTGRTVALATALLASSTFLNISCNKDNGSGFADVLPTIQLIGQDFTAPVALVESPDNSGRLFVVDEIGKIRVILADGRLLPQPFLDVSASMVPLQANYDERGLLGLAFHPNHKTNGKFYVFYTVPSRGGGPAVGLPWN